MEFDQPQPRSRDDLAIELRSEHPARIATAIIAAALHDPDRFYVESLIVRFLNHEDRWVRGAAAIAAGHVTRIHRELTRDPIVPMLKRLLDDPPIDGKAQDALEDIEMFLSQR